MRAHWIAWALTLGFALTVTAGAGSFVFATDAGVPGTLDGENGAGIGGPDVPVSDWDREADALGNRSTEFWTIGLAVRWGYLNDPAVAALEGRWMWDENRTGGGFRGRWHLIERRIGGDLWGQFALPDDGQGRFRGEWNVDGSRVTGTLSGSWIRTDRGGGSFDGNWEVTGGRGGGALAGTWASTSDDGGAFRGRGIAAPSLDPVDWDGFLATSEGATYVLRTVRWERGEDEVRQRDRQSVEWQSTTTVNWDGLMFALRIPKVRPVPQVTLHTAQISFTWDATELLRLHVRHSVDRLGHEIEVRSFGFDRDGCDRCEDRHDYVRIQVGMRWGLLDNRGYDDDSRDRTEWDGGARVSVGGLGVEAVLSFERGDYLLPRRDRAVVMWESATTTGWDGVVVVWLVPVGEIDRATFTIHAGAFEHTFSIRELPGDHVFDVDREGHQVQVRAVRG